MNGSFGVQRNAKLQTFLSFLLFTSAVKSTWAMKISKL